VEWYLLAIGLVVLLGIYLVLTLFYKPLSLLVKLLAYMIMGLVLLCLGNFVLGFFNLHVAINPITIMVAGVLQFPGLVMLILLGIWFI